nr:PREDICTED: choline transporter-like protein 4 [Latimeria chalumnae]|eukprot:XP_006007253.2 PREDICTED: choline transporter-like protein 4 [Latimeria chalumnae]
MGELVYYRAQVFRAEVRSYEMGQKSGLPQEKQQHGEAASFDPSFNGPIKNRSCTDIICCFLFMVFVLGYIIVGILAWLYGDPREVIYPRNSTGMYCGFGANQAKPFVFYFDLLKCAAGTSIMAAALNGLQCPTTQICVAKCPDTYWILPLEAYLPSAKPGDFFHKEYCQPSYDPRTTMTVEEVLRKEICPRFTIKSSPFLNRCLPDVASPMPSNFTLDGSNSTNETTQLVKNATQALVIAMIVSLLFLLLLRFTAAVMIWVLILALITVVAYGIWHCYWEYSSLNENGATINDVSFTTDLSVYFRVKETWLAFFIILIIVEVIILLVLLFLRKRILIAIALIKEASKAVGHMMSSLFFPIFTFTLLLICILYWGVTALYLATSGAPLYRVVTLNSSAPNCNNISGEVPCDPMKFNSSNEGCQYLKCIFYKYNEEGLFQRNVFNLQIYNIIGFLWCMNFVIALGQCTLAGAFASYYWAFNKPGDIPFFAVSASFMRAIRYHTGSLAFGALILTIVQVIRIILEYLDHKLKDSQNAVTKFLFCCLKCCFWCLEKFIKWLNRNAYIMIAIYGKNFCVSAKNAFSLLMRNIVRVVVLDKVVDLLLLFGKLLVVGGVGVLSFFFFTGRIQIDDPFFRAPTLHYYWIPILTVLLGSYMIAQGFFSVYSMCVDTLFLCFLEDLERNDGSIQKPYYMSKSLMKILNKKNEMTKQGKKK